jgi:hypothetical protein
LAQFGGIWHNGCAKCHGIWHISMVFGTFVAFGAIFTAFGTIIFGI